MKEKVFWCGGFDPTCPYMSHIGTCLMVNEGLDPMEECDEAPDGEWGEYKEENEND